MRRVLGKEEYTQLMGFPGSEIWKSAVRLDALSMSTRKVVWERATGKRCDGRSLPLGAEEEG